MTPFCKVRNFLGCGLLALLLFPNILLAQSAVGNSIDTLQIGQQDGATVVKIGLRQALTAPPSSFSVADPARVVFDFPQSSNGLGRNIQEANQGDLRSVNIVQAGDRTRMVLNMSKMAPFDAKLDGNFVVITLQTTGTKDATPTTATAERAAQHFPELKGKDVLEHAVRDIAFRRSPAGEGVVTIDLADASTGIDVRQQGTNLVIDFQNTKLPENLRRKMDVMDFATPVTTVTSTTVGDNVRVVITPSGLWEHSAYQTDNQFVVQVKPIKEDPNKLFQGTQQRGYQGEKITLNFQNIPLRELLYVFADITGFNIVVSDNIAGNVSLRLNDVPWDQALEIVMQQQGLAMRKNGNVMQIGRAAELAKQEEDSLKAKQALNELEPTRTESFQINYQKADAILKMLTDKTQPILSKRGTAVVDAYTNKLFVTDTPTRLTEIKNLIFVIDKPNRQVMIEAKVIQAADDFGRALGVRLGFTSTKQTNILNGGSTAVAAGSPAYPLTAGTTNSAAMPLALNAGAIGTMNFTLFNSAATRLLNLELQASESDGRSKTISNPRIVTENNTSAKIEDGKEIPIVTPGTANSPPTVTYRNAKIVLDVTPQITPDGRVKMKLTIAKEKADTAGANPVITSSKVNTEVMVENGGTLVIGGVSGVDDEESETKVPFLGDIPVMGNLFKFKNQTKRRTELLVFITPRVLDQKLSF